MVEATRKKKQAEVPNLTKSIVKTHRPESVVKMIASSKKKGKGKDRKKLRFLAKGGTPGSTSNTSNINNLECPVEGCGYELK